MKSHLVIPVHSFVDLITNSSSEVYVMAGKGTIQSIKDIVNKLLAIGGSQQTADDLFTFELETSVDTFSSERPAGMSWGHRITETEWNELKAKGEFADDKVFEKEYDGDGYQEMSVRVTAKHPGHEDAAKMLSNLENLFSLEASYNG